MTPAYEDIEDIRAINCVIEPEGKVIVKTRCDVSNESYLVLKNVAKTAADCWKDLAVGGTITWSELEKLNLKRISSSILQRDKRWVRINDQESLDAIERLIHHKWLVYDDERNRGYLGPRFSVQMKPWIQETQNHKHQICKACGRYTFTIFPT